MEVELLGLVEEEVVGVEVEEVVGLEEVVEERVCLGGLRRT